MLVAILMLHTLSAQDVIRNFKVPEIDDEGRLKSMLMGAQATIVPGKPMPVEDLRIQFFQPDGKTVKLNIVSPGCVYDPKEGVAVSEQPIRIFGDGFLVSGVGYRYEKDRERMEIHNNVRVRFRRKASSPDEQPEEAAAEPPSEPAESE